MRLADLMEESREDRFTQNLNEASSVMLARIAETLVKELQQLEQKYRQQLAVSNEIPFEHHPKVWMLYSSQAKGENGENVNMRLVTIKRSQFALLQEWHDAKELILDFLKEEGYIDGILPVTITIDKSGVNTLRLVLT